VKPAPFEYHRPESLEAALQLLAAHGDEAKPLAGGQSLIPLLAMRLALPGHIVDLQRVPELRGISVDDSGVRIGAMVSQREVERDGRMPDLVAAAVPHIAHFQIRNRGTVGGSLSHMDPAAEWPALALVLDAVMVAASTRGRRELPARDFVVGPMMTALEPDELLVEVVLPAAGEPFGFAEVERRSGDFALVGVACYRQAVCVFATGPRPQRLERVEEFLRGGGRPGKELEALAASEIEATGDIHASAEYRRQVGASLVGRLVAHLDRSREAPAWS
jgi:carbon-monoxide dehydrogenase medium subunit